MDTVPAPPPLRDLFDTPALRVLRAVAEGPLIMKSFTFLSGLSPKKAKVLRQQLEAAGFVVLEVPIPRVSTDIAIRATPLGLHVAEESARLLRLVYGENPSQWHR